MKSSYTRFFLCLLLGILCLPLTSSAQTSEVRGTVLSPEGEPLAGATVVIPSIQKGAYTNAAGIFSIPKLEAGSYTIYATYLGYDTAQQEINLVPNKTITVRLVMQTQTSYTTDVVEIVDRKETKIEKKDVDIAVTRVTAEKINLIPSIGAPDLSQYLQVLPGVVFTGDQGGQLYIRGGTPIQNMVLLDGMIIYSPFHSIGLFSVFDTDYIRSADVHSAGFPSEYGGRISSVIDIKTKTGNFKNYGAKFNVNPFSAGALVEGPISRSKKGIGGTSFLLSIRNSYLDKTSNIFYPYVNDSIGLPYNFLDIYGKISISDGANFVNLFGFRHEDNVNFEFPADYNWRSFGGGASFMLLPSTASVILNGGFSYSRFESGLQSQSETFPRNSSVNGFNGGLNLSYIINSIDEAAFGVNILGFSTDYVFTNSFGFRSEQQSNNTEISFYGKYKKVFKGYSKKSTAIDSTIERFVLEPGLHLHYYNNQQFFSFEPRLRAKLNFDRVSFSLAGGMYAQNLLSANSDRDVVNLFQGFLSAPEGLPDRLKNHNLQTARHLLIGTEVELASNMKATVEGWLKDFTQLTNVNRNKIFPSDPNFITETGLAYGFDIILNYETPSLYLYGTYGWAKVTRDDGTQVYNPVFDRRHNINFVGAYKIGTLDRTEGDRVFKSKFSQSKWEFSVRWALGSGFPFTQTQGYFEKLTFLEDGAQTDYSSQNGQLGLILSENLNAGRLPYYHRLDLSAKRRWALKDKLLIEASLGAINVYDRNNIFYFDRIRFAAVYQLPILPSLGLSITY